MQARPDKSHSRLSATELLRGFDSRRLHLSFQVLVVLELALSLGHAPTLAQRPL
jgi:hypothetical protein